MPAMTDPLSLSYRSFPNTTSQFVTHEVSDGGLATSTHRLAVNTGTDVSQGRSNIFGPGAKPISLPKLNAFLGSLQQPSFSPWSDILTPQEVQDYQNANHRKFPLSHLIPPGLSLNDLKSNTLKRKVLPGFENDLWRFLVEVCVLTAGSPYGQYLSVDIFRAYTRTMLSLYSGSQPGLVEKAMAWTGGGSLTLTVVFLLILVVTYKTYCMEHLQSSASPWEVPKLLSSLIIARFTSKSDG